ncbi:L-xylulose reductase isoform X1 [Eurytemora carolleeae]|uniref:L-xylulose reductase isoform X1 n=1 Tax=Eurytemora carolleeae TaxID=1294199 RepID=UPI000C7750C7|nr:L-xylulose reductase isoform X1 [Eurytemora carolleeae]|eukprot:XP_023331818.1 L-xylulose reductase-like isoform X1 [Eurytemora affinis]
MAAKFDFNGRRVLVTGAGAGIGRGICKALYESGAEVYGVSRTQENLNSLKVECPDLVTVCVDLSDWDATRAALSLLPTMHGVVNNAAIAINGSCLTAKPEDFDKMYTGNVKQVLNVSQIFALKMIQDKIRGAIVNISSQASQAALKDHVLYCGTKGALDIMSKVMGLELGEHGIRVNCVNPTVVLTSMGKLAWSDPAKAGPMLDKIPLGRFAEIDDVVSGVLFLLSDQAALINAVTLPIDGGFLAT